MNAQSAIQNLLDEMTASGDERGVQVAVYQHGALIVDAFSGLADPGSGRAVDGGTLFPVFSISKGVTATLVHQAVERGLLAYDQPIAAVWPEFAARGKEGLTLRQGLNHSAGLPNVPRAVDYEVIADWTRTCAAVAELEPVFPPGSHAAYHAITYGWIVGEPVCRVTGKTFPEILRDQIAAPLGVDGLFIGVPEGVASRIAVLEEAAPSPPPADPFAPAPVPGWIGPLHAFMNRPDMQRASIPGSSGVMNARSVARHYAALLPGGVDGLELLPPARLREALQPQGLLTAEGLPSSWALGYHRYDQFSLPGSPDPAFGHGAYGGAIAFAEPGRGLAVAILKNRMNSGDTVGRVFQRLVETLGS